MRILVLSDSHRYTHIMVDTIRSLNNDIDMIIHLGDSSDDIKPFIHILKNKQLHVITGNCDANISIPSEKIITISGKKIFMTHGHRYNVKSGFDRIIYAALERKANICLFGHTHFPVIFKEEKTLFMNPGSIAYPRGIDTPSYGIIDISEEREVEMSVVGKNINGLCRIII